MCQLLAGFVDYFRQRNGHRFCAKACAKMRRNGDAQSRPNLGHEPLALEKRLNIDEKPAINFAAADHPDDIMHSGRRGVAERRGPCFKGTVWLNEYLANCGKNGRL